MALTFIGDMGVYLPTRDAIKITAADGDKIIDCYVQRSALDALGCADIERGVDLVRELRANRETVESAALAKYRRARTASPEITVEAEDVAAVLPPAVA